MPRDIEVEVISDDKPYVAPLPTSGERWSHRKSPEGGCGGCFLVPVFIIIAWGVEFFDSMLGGNLENLGIQPRNFYGLFGIVFSPWLHGNLEHLILNTVTFLGLGTLMAALRGSAFLKTSLLIAIFSGLGTWLIGRPLIHIGASGVLYGYFGYLIGRAWHERSMGWAGIGIGVAFFYGGLIGGLIPGLVAKNVSVEAHISGLLAGFLVARWDSKRDR